MMLSHRSRRPSSVALLALASLLTARASGAATISLVLDQPTYLPGQTVTIRLIGDSEGATDIALAARLHFDPAALLGAQAQTFVPPSGGSDVWHPGGLQGCINPGVCYLMNMIQSPPPALGLGVDPAVEPFT